MGRILIYTKRIPEMIDFYSKFFDYEHSQIKDDRIVELRSKVFNIVILLHPASKAQKEGQSTVKLVFDVKNVEDFCQKSKVNGLTFGAIHKANGYSFANAKDPSKNSISVSSRAFVIV